MAKNKESKNIVNYHLEKATPVLFFIVIIIIIFVYLVGRGVKGKSVGLT